MVIRMKERKIKILLVITLISALAIITIFIYKKQEENKYLVSLNIDELVEKIEKEESFPLLIIQDGCSYCELFKPTVKEVSYEYKLNIYTLNLTDLSNKDKEELKNIFTTTSTPIMLFIESGAEGSTLNRINGNVKKDKLIDKLKLNEYIKE